MKKLHSIPAIISLMALLLSSFSAQASSLSYGFSNITNDNTDVSGQLLASIYDQTGAASSYGQTIGANEVLFTFQNNVGIASYISNVYFANASSLFQSQTGILNNLTGSTSYGTILIPGNLPDGLPGFAATIGFGAGVFAPINGVSGSSDTLGIVIMLANGLGISDIEDALLQGGLQIGLQVRNIGGFAQGSDSFINNPNPNGPSAVPVPAAIWLFGSAFLGLFGYNKRDKTVKA